VTALRIPRISIWSFILTLGLLAVVQLVVPRPMLLLQRLTPALGWIEAVALASYAGWIAHRLSVDHSGRWRRRIWTLFSMVFFAQLALGVAGQEFFLMAPPRMHLPVPALILAGPLYRGDHFFMLILFVATTLLVGPAWCSYLCYLGAWDQRAADCARKPRGIHNVRPVLRGTITLLVPATAIVLRVLGSSAALAGALALTFGLLGIVVMLVVSRRRGVLVHCTLYCPVGLVATLLGRISPFRVVISDGCDGCMRCRVACRYDALDREAVAAGRPHPTLCTLCGDCLSSCPTALLGYRLMGLPLDASSARTLFLVLVVALHAATLGLARI